MQDSVECRLTERRLVDHRITARKASHLGLPVSR